MQWIDIQRRTLTHWINFTIGQIVVRDLFTDLRDGTVAVRVVEVVTQQPLKDVFREPVSVAQSEQNIRVILQLLRSEKGLCFHMTPADVVNGNKAITLSFVWNIILHFQLRHRWSSRHVLMTWVGEERLKIKNE